jgi:hypothetical protein
MCVECDQTRRGGNLEMHRCSRKTYTKSRAIERLMRFDLRKQPSIRKRAGAAAQSATRRFEIDGFERACNATPRIAHDPNLTEMGRDPKQMMDTMCQTKRR